ncbi:hypothetical protein ACFFRR_000842 [Megaselia abdita]
MSSIITSNYVPDSINLVEDVEAAEYWFQCFQDLSQKFSQQAVASSRDDDTSAVSRSQNFLREFKQRLDEFKQNKSPLSSLSIRELLELNETLLRLHGFNDPWMKQKELENNSAVESFRSRIDDIDMIEDNKLRWTELVRGVLAGNIFDWGAQIVAEILQNDAKFGLTDALNKIQKRPWLFDDLDMWLNRILNSSHKCALIFVDNSGVDIVLGILPFARELLKRNTKVILAANSEPSLNDVTFTELKGIVEECKLKCDILRNALENSKLLVVSNGQKGPCLDMRNLPKGW